MKKQKIVIIEDEHSISEMYKYKLKYDGYDVYTASNSWDGIDLVNKVHPDLLLLDILMPYENGISTLTKLQKNNMNKNLKVLFMTNSDLQSVPDNIKNVDYNRYVLKCNTTPKQVSQMVKEELQLK